MKNCLVVLWSCGTGQDMYHCQMLPSGKLRAMETALARCQAEMDRHQEKLTKTEGFQAIFVAPEYYFTNKGNQREPLGEEQKVNLEGILLEYSRRHKNILIVPGSIYYAKPLLRTAQTLKLDRKTGMLTNQTPEKDRAPKVIANIEKAAIRTKEARGTELGNHMYWKNGAVGTSAISNRQVPSFRAKREAVTFLRPDIVRNSTYLFLDGTRYAKYDKQSDFHESLLAPHEMVFVPGTRDECPFVGQYRFGIEICADHVSGALKRRQPNPLDFHVVISDYVSSIKGNMAMSDCGYFIHASSALHETQVWHRNGSQVSQVTGYSEPASSGQLKFWLLPMPHELKAARGLTTST